MDPRCAAAWCAKIAPLSEGESLNARSSCNQLDNDPIASELLR
jgi:hypothetical protein